MSKSKLPRATGHIRVDAMRYQAFVLPVETTTPPAPSDIDSVIPTQNPYVRSDSNHPVRAYSQALFPRSHSNIGYYDAFLSASDLRPAKRMKYDENATERLRAAQELQVTNQQEIDTFRSQLLQLLEDGYTTAATSGKLQFSLEKALFNSGLGSMQSPIIKMDSFKVVGYLYCAVLKEIAEIVSLRAAEGGKLTAENCWGSNDLIRYLIKKHLSIIFTSEAAHDCSATAHFPDNFSEESNCDEVALLVEANNYAGTTSGASSISDPSDFSFCCHYFECLKKKLVRVSRWKRKFSTVYHLEGTVRRSLQLALSLKAEGTELLSICNISNELNRLEADIIKCLSLKKRIKTECPSLFDDSVPLSVSRKLAVELGDDYSLLPFRFYEGDCLINSIELSTVWYQQLEKERSLPTQDATTYKTLLCTHSRLLIQSQDVEALELFVASSDWLDRISKIVNTRKQYNLSHMIEVVSKTQHMEIHKNNEVINELRSSSLIITKWISDVISPPLCNLLSISELVSLESALDILMNCPILNFGGWTNPSPSTNVSTPEQQQQQSESNASDSTSLSLFFEKNSPMSNPKATPPALLESLWTRYAQVRVNINAYRTLDNCRAKLLKWKKKKTRFLTSIQTVSYNEVLSLYQEGHQMSQLFELYDDLLEISQVIEKYKSWCSEVDEFLLATQHVTLVNSRLRNLNSEGPNEHTNSAAAGDAEVDTIEDNALRRCNSGKLILADAYRVLNSLSCSGDVRPSVERLNNLLEMAESSCVLDQSRFKELRALSDHVEKWKRRSKECLKAKSATKSLERLKLVLLVEAKYFRVDMNLEKRLSQEFYCKIWRDRVISSCLAQLDEEEFTLAIELPLKEEFLSLLNAEKTIYGKPLPSETTAIAEDHLNIQEVLESKSEVDVLRILKHFQCKWNGEFTEFIATKPSLEDVESFKLRLVNYPVKLTSIIDSIDGIKSNHHLIEQAILAFPTKISVSSLESMQLRVASCPIPSTSWYKYEEMIITGRTIEAEIRARRACLKMTLLDVTALESYLISLDSEDLDFSCVVDPILEEIAIVVNWFNEKAKLLSSSFPQTIERLLSHSSKGSDLDIDPLELEKFSSEIKLAQSWRRLLLSLTRTRKIHYNEATLLLEMNRNGILLVESFNLENESVLFKREIENGIEALNKSASLITRRVYMSTILHNEVQLLEEVIATISELRRIAERLESFSLIEFPELLRRTLEECKFNESHLKLILCLTCCVPHIGCPIRNWGRRRFHKGCVPYVPLSAATELLQAITSQQNIEHHEMMFDWDLLGSEFPEHVTTIECLRNVSKELGLPPPLPLTVDEELVSMLKERLQRSLEWNNQYESVVGITLKGIPDFIWPSTSHEIWNLLSNKEEVIHTTIPCPSENLLPYWDNWMENCVDEHRCTTITQNISVADCFGIMLPSEILCSSLCSTSHVTKICGVSVRHNMSEEFTSFEEGSGGISYVHSTILDNLIERVYPHLTNSFHRSDILNALELYYAEGFIFENGHTRSLLKASLLIHIVFWKYVSETMRMEPSANVSLGSIIETKCPPSPQATIADILGYLELLELLPFQTPFKIELLNRAKYMIDMSNIARQCLTLLPVSKCDEDELPYEVPSGEDLHRVMSKEFGIEEPIRPPMPVGVDQLVVSNNRSLSDDQSLEATLAFIQSSGKAEFTSICDICADSTSPLNEVSIWIKCDTCKRWIHKSCAFLPENISDSILRYQYTCIVCLCHNQKSNFKVLFATNWYSVWLQSFIKGPKLRSHPSVGRLVELHRSNLLLQTEAELIGNHLGLIVLWLLDFSLCALNTDGKHVEIDPMPNWPSNAVVGGASKRPRVKTSASLHTPENPKVKGRAKRRGRTGKTAETKPIIEGFVKSSDVCEINNQIFILADKALEFVSFNQPITSVLDFTFNFVKECVRYKGDSSVPLSKLINANYRMVLNFGSGDEEYIASSTGNLKPANFLISAAFAGLYQHPLISFLFQVITADNNRYEMLNSMRLSLLPSNTEEIHAIFNTDITPVQWLQDPSLVFNRLIDHLDCSSSTMSSSNLELEKLKECISTLSEKFNLFLRILASNAPRVTVGLGNIYVAGASNNDDDVVDSSLFKECYDSTAKVLSAELQKVGSLYIRMTTEGFVLSSNAAESMWEEWVSWWQNCLANSTLFYADRNSTPKESSLEQSYNSLRESRERVCELTVELGILCEILNSSRDVESPKLMENRGEQPPPPPYKVSVTYLKSFLEVIEPYKLENANVVYRYYLSQLDILKRLESLSNTKKQLSYDSYQSLLTLVEGSPCYLGPTGDRFISQINQVTKWVEAAREAVRTPITTDTTTAVNQALVVKKDCGGLVVDMTRSKIYGDVKRFIRDVKRHLQQPQDMMNAAAAQMSSMPWMGMGRYVYPYVPPYMTPDPYMMQADDPYGVYRNMQQQQQQQQQQPSPPPPHN